MDKEENQIDISTKRTVSNIFMFGAFCHVNISCVQVKILKILREKNILIWFRCVLGEISSVGGTVFALQVLVVVALIGGKFVTLLGISLKTQGYFVKECALKLANCHWHMAEFNHS